MFIGILLCNLSAREVLEQPERLVADGEGQPPAILGVLLVAGIAADLGELVSGLRRPHPGAVVVACDDIAGLLVVEEVLGLQRLAVRPDHFLEAESVFFEDLGDLDGIASDDGELDCLARLSRAFFRSKRSPISRLFH